MLVFVTGAVHHEMFFFPGETRTSSISGIRPFTLDAPSDERSNQRRGWFPLKKKHSRTRACWKENYPKMEVSNLIDFLQKFPAWSVQSESAAAVVHKHSFLFIYLFIYLFLGGEKCNHKPGSSVNHTENHRGGPITHVIHGLDMLIEPYVWYFQWLR